MLIRLFDGIYVFGSMLLGHFVNPGVVHIYGFHGPHAHDFLP
jgi:hypothetical protein